MAIKDNKILRENIELVDKFLKLENLVVSEILKVFRINDENESHKHLKNIMMIFENSFFMGSLIVEAIIDRFLDISSEFMNNFGDKVDELIQNLENLNKN